MHNYIDEISTKKNGLEWQHNSCEMSNRLGARTRGFKFHHWHGYLFLTNDDKVDCYAKI
jgi:hypothetical protein